VSFSILVWIVSIVGCGIAGEPSVNSYWLLLFFRATSGVSEAAFQCIVPPLIQDRCDEDELLEELAENNLSTTTNITVLNEALFEPGTFADQRTSENGNAKNQPAAKPKKRGATWLGIYFTAIPVGIAMGYIYGSAVSTTSLGWSWAFYIEAIVMAPLFLFAFALRRSEIERQNLRDSVAFVSKSSLVENVMKSPGVRSPSMKLKDDMKQSLLDAEASNAGSDPGKGGNDTSVEVTQKKLLRAATRRMSQLSAPPPAKTSDASFVEANSTASFVIDVEKPSLWKEIVACFTSPMFLCIVGAYAAYTAVMISVSTFGSAFVMALGLFNKETSASLVFGGLISVAGVIGTPIGGIMIDRIQEKEGDGSDVAPEYEYAKLTKLFLQLEINVLIGTLLLVVICFASNKYVFSAFMLLGCIFCFTATSFFNIGAMMTVPKENRAFAVALLTFGIHAFGDVPAPTIVGYIKDVLAPACTINSDGDFDDLDKCRDQKGGIRLTLFSAIAWMMWTVVFSEVARRIAMYKDKQAIRRGGAREPLLGSDV
jgi:MFS family permease